MLGDLRGLNYEKKRQFDRYKISCHFFFVGGGGGGEGGEGGGGKILVILAQSSECKCTWVSLITGLD